jgi:hypothetical protein
MPAHRDQRICLSVDAISDEADGLINVAIGDIFSLAEHFLVAG